MKGNRFIKKRRVTPLKRLTEKNELPEKLVSLKNAKALEVVYHFENGNKMTSVKIGTVKEICDFFNHVDTTLFEESLINSLTCVLKNRGFDATCRWISIEEAFKNAKTIENYSLY